MTTETNWDQWAESTCRRCRLEFGDADELSSHNDDVHPDRDLAADIASLSRRLQRRFEETHQLRTALEALSVCDDRNCVGCRGIIDRALAPSARAVN